MFMSLRLVCRFSASHRGLFMVEARSIFGGVRPVYRFLSGNVLCPAPARLGRSGFCALYQGISCVRAMGVRIYELMKALRVLVIEDDAVIAMLLSQLLKG